VRKSASLVSPNSERIVPPRIAWVAGFQLRVTLRSCPVWRFMEIALPGGRPYVNQVRHDAGRNDRLSPPPCCDRLKALQTRPYLVALLIGLAAQTLFTLHLDRPSRIMFDEVHYVPAAQALLALDRPAQHRASPARQGTDRGGNVLFGDNPFGWRACRAWRGRRRCRRLRLPVAAAGLDAAALVGAALTALNQSLFVQARTAMLDVFLGAFLSGRWC
jgi:dolichyl-phosphate-mannose--protein O-mannosyl transferase